MTLFELDRGARRADYRMLTPIHAILAGALILAAPSPVVREAPPAAARPDTDVAVDPPQRITFRLADGVRISGELVAWSERGFDGSFGGRRWSELLFADVEPLLRRLVDREDLHHHVTAGMILLALGDDEAAGRFFVRARQLDADQAGPLIEQAQHAEADRRRRDAEQRRAAEAERLSTISPEARDWPASPWPALSSAEQQQASEIVRNEAEKKLAAIGAALSPVVGEHVILWSDLERREAAEWARLIDRLVARLLSRFGLPPGEAHFQGRAAVFVFAEQDRFRLMEVQAFDHLTSASTLAVAHFEGPLVFVNAWRPRDRDAFAAALLGEVVHGFMHRYRSPRRLPPWANEGLAGLAAAQMLEDSPAFAERRAAALRFIREGGDMKALLGLEYADERWPGPEGVTAPVGALVLELMIAERPAAFVRWVDAVKGGADWREALHEHFGVDADRLAQTAARWYAVND